MKKFKEFMYSLPITFILLLIVTYVVYNNWSFIAMFLYVLFTVFYVEEAREYRKSKK